ncbi:MAG TPA: SDR family NAD(P)-dependent oxidoreductase [Myxococcales bacterium]|nr:SDR family NAD(P)-dependent oxidoreductase [Myxococcales bacterium]
MGFKKAFITGASSGLGRGLSLHYARAGATVYAAARRRAELESLAAEAAAAGAAGRVVPLVLDVADAEAQVAAIARAEEESGGLDLVIANAGVRTPTPGRSLDWAEVKRILDINVSAACVTLSAALPALIARGRGTVAAVSSLAAFLGLPGRAAYSASKAALHIFMESLRVDLRKTGVRAVTIYPGYVKTEMTATNERAMPFVMELDTAVEVMARGLARGQPTIAYPLPMVAMVKAAAALPGPIWEALAATLPFTRPPK